MSFEIGYEPFKLYLFRGFYFIGMSFKQVKNSNVIIAATKAILQVCQLNKLETISSRIYSSWGLQQCIS